MTRLALSCGTRVTPVQQILPRTVQPACKWFVSDVKKRARRRRAAQNFRFGMASRSHLGTQVADHKAAVRALLQTRTDYQAWRGASRLSRHVPKPERAHPRGPRGQAGRPWSSPG